MDLWIKSLPRCSRFSLRINVGEAHCEEPEGTSHLHWALCSFLVAVLLTCLGKVLLTSLLDTVFGLQMQLISNLLFSLAGAS